MSKSTILRVKRRLEENPQDAFVLTCKKIKTEELSPSLFVFSGTVENQDHAFISKLVPKEIPKIKTASSVKSIIEKIRQEKKDNTIKQRYKVVNTIRGITDSGSEETNNVYNFVDLEKKDLETNNTNKYAYDVYIAAKQDFDISMLDDLVRTNDQEVQPNIENYETELIFGSHRDNGRVTPSSGEESSDDSNDENNWRNDYPEEENSSIEEDDMIRAMERVDLDDLSSDEGEDKIYDNPANAEDVKRYGQAYAKYKARVTADITDSRSFVHCSKFSEEEEDGYRGDSDDGFYYGQEEDTDNFKEQYKDEISSDEFDPD